MPVIGNVPTQLLLQRPRLAIAESQKQLAGAQIEAASGRHHDMGLALGDRTGSAISLRLELAGASQAKDLAQQAGTRAQATQSALSSLNAMAETFRSTLAGARGSENGKALGAAAARASLGSLRDVLSASLDGQYLFGGLNSQSAPLTDYGTGPRQAAIAAFQAEFGFAPDDAAAAGLSATQLSSFLDGAFADLFAPSSWTSVWSSATSETPRASLGEGQSVDVSANANAPFARLLAQALTMVETLASGKIGAAAFQTVADKALSTISRAQLEIGNEQARIGLGQSSLEASVRLQEDRTAKLSTAIQSLEGVDLYEASTRVNVLMTQLESSYALTGRISRMSLLNYI